MNRQEYINNCYIVEFVNWVRPRISGEIEFKHEYVLNKKKKSWKCNSIYNAFENYQWDYTCTLPNGKCVKGNTFMQNDLLLDEIQEGMKIALEEEDVDNLMLFSKSLLKWGGVFRSNYYKLEKMGDDIIPYFQSTCRKLNPCIVDTNDYMDDIKMNSGFTKIYSMLIKDFAIYDSRVGAALGLLVREFLQDKNIEFIPEVLNFSYGNSRPTKSDNGLINKRNPSSNKYKFTQLSNNSKKHIKNNIYANWLFSEIVENSKFKYEKKAIRALESSLFMIGYKVNDGVKLPE